LRKGLKVIENNFYFCGGTKKATFSAEFKLLKKIANPHKKAVCQKVKDVVIPFLHLFLFSKVLIYVLFS
jgi:hypothetical protein